MKQIMLWLLFASFSIADTNVTDIRVLEYESKTLYHLYTKEYALALGYTKLGCSLGSGTACSNVGYIYAEKYIDGKAHYFKAHQYYKKACKLKNSYACTSAGLFYEEGLGLNTSYIEEAKPYYAEGCKLGSGRACNQLALVNYRQGHVEVAMTLYLKACKASFGMGCYNYAHALEKGLRVKVDFKKAVFYYREGCRLGDSLSCALSAAMIYKEESIEKSEALANEYLEKACALKHEPSCEVLTQRSHL